MLIVEVTVRHDDRDCRVSRTVMLTEVNLENSAEVGALVDAMLQGVDDEIKHIEENRKG